MSGWVEISILVVNAVLVPAIVALVRVLFAMERRLVRLEIIEELKPK